MQSYLFDNVGKQQAGGYQMSTASLTALRRDPGVRVHAWEIDMLKMSDVDVGERLAKLRHYRKQWNQTQAAKHFDIPEKTWNKYELGQRELPKRLGYDLAGFFGVAPMWLLFGEPGGKGRRITAELDSLPPPPKTGGRPRKEKSSPPGVKKITK